MFKRIDHIELAHFPQPQRAIDFYTGVLGFQVRARDRVPQTPMGPLELVYLELGGTTVELMCYSGKDHRAEKPEELLGYRMMALEVEDMDRALALLKARGIETSWGPVRRLNYARARSGTLTATRSSCGSGFGLGPDLIGRVGGRRQERGSSARSPR